MVERLRRKTLKSVWGQETKFTRWLVENIDVLNEVLDLDLSAADPEQAAGDFNVDVIAEDESGLTFAIENQFEKSDHDHLGKLITYYSVLGADGAVWIVETPRAEHVTAINWLNEVREAAFYLVKAEAVTVGASDPAPLLTLIVGPPDMPDTNNTGKEFKERHYIRKQFWTGLLDTARTHTSLHAAISPSTETWIGAGAGISGLSFNYVANQHAARVELYIDRGEGEENRRVFDYLHDRREDIEKAFGGQLQWGALPEKRACRVSAPVSDEHGWRDEEHWSELHEQMATSMQWLEDALRTHIEDVRSIV